MAVSRAEIIPSTTATASLMNYPPSLASTAHWSNTSVVSCFKLTEETLFTILNIMPKTIGFSNWNISVPNSMIIIRLLNVPCMIVPSWTIWCKELWSTLYICLCMMYYYWLAWPIPSTIFSVTSNPIIFHQGPGAHPTFQVHIGGLIMDADKMTLLTNYEYELVISIPDQIASLLLARLVCQVPWLQIVLMTPQVAHLCVVVEAASLTQEGLNPCYFNKWKTIYIFLHCTVIVGTYRTLQTSQRNTIHYLYVLQLRHQKEKAEKCKTAENSSYHIQTSMNNNNVSFTTSI